MRRSWIDTQSTIFQPDGESLPLNIRIGVLLRAGLHLYQKLFSKWVKMCGRVKRAHQANSVFEVRQLALGVAKIGLRLMQPAQRQTQINFLLNCQIWLNLPLHCKLVLSKGEGHDVDVAGLLVEGVVAKHHVARHAKVHPRGVAHLLKQLGSHLVGNYPTLLSSYSRSVIGSMK